MDSSNIILFGALFVFIAMPVDCLHKRVLLHGDEDIAAAVQMLTTQNQQLTAQVNQLTSEVNTLKQQNSLGSGGDCV